MDDKFKVMRIADADSLIHFSASAGYPRLT
jgi:hypothetical protein